MKTATLITEKMQNEATKLYHSIVLGWLKCTCRSPHMHLQKYHKHWQWYQQQTTTYINRRNINSEDKCFKKQLVSFFLFYFIFWIFQKAKKNIQLELTFKPYPQGLPLIVEGTIQAVKGEKQSIFLPSWKACRPQQWWGRHDIPKSTIVALISWDSQHPFNWTNSLLRRRQFIPDVLT